MTALNTETLEQFAAENDLLLSDPLINFARLVSEAAVYENKKPHTLVSDRAKWFAIGEILSSWPSDLTADQVIKEVELATDDVVVWEPFENWDGADVADYINGLAQSAQKLMTPVIMEPVGEVLNSSGLLYLEDDEGNPIKLPEGTKLFTCSSVGE